MTTASRIALIAGSCLALGIAGCAEEKISMSDLPSAVRATLVRETAGGLVVEIEKEKKDDQVVYSADAEVGDKTWDLCIAEDGRLISKKSR